MFSEAVRGKGSVQYARLRVTVTHPAQSDILNAYGAGARLGIC
jgi:hypothetical protein